MFTNQNHAAAAKRCYILLVVPWRIDVPTRFVRVGINAAVGRLRIVADQWNISDFVGKCLRSGSQGIVP